MNRRNWSGVSEVGLKDLDYKIVYVSGVDNLVRKFYIPVLSEATIYKRRTGYFNSRALAMAARGISKLIEKKGKMLLLCSVELDADDELALRDPIRFVHEQQEKVIEQLDRPYDELEKKRLALLAELQAGGNLEIRICVKQGGIYHEKTGVLYDEKGDYVVFTGSGNETPGGWVKNVENFSVFNSWNDSKAYADEHIKIFEMEWDGTFPGIDTYPVGQAILEKIARFRDYYEQGHDEEIDPADIDADRKPDDMWTWTPELAFISEAPRLWNSGDFAYGEMGVTPFEHQDYIASKALKQWPPRYLLCDEVGLGKTIEAGLIIQGSIAQGHARNVLILVPKNAMVQWQQELYTKFRLTFWRLEGSYVIGPKLHPDDEPERLPINPINPMATKEQMLVSSQLVRLDERQKQVLDRHWDLIVLDEAHHARAGFAQKGETESRTPNKLLGLLRRLKFQTQGLLLLSATPIQIDRRELWDLLDILELPGKWQDPEKFNAFIDAIDADPIDWGFLFSMVQDQGQHEMEQNELRYKLKRQYPDINAPRIIQILKDGDPQAAYQLNETEKEALKLLIFMYTPIRRLVFRNTRELLKKYRREGKFSGEIADREPEKIPIQLTGSEDDPSSEAGLYKRIEDYVTEYYGKYKNIRKGLGFIMVTYRKRLTSSFKAITISLTRRYEKLNRAIESNDLSELFNDIHDLSRAIDDEFIEALDDPDEDDFSLLQLDAAQVFSDQKLLQRLRKLIQHERDYLETFIHDLENLTGDTKFDEFRKELHNLLEHGQKQVIVFSQFKDTVNYLRKSFIVNLGDRVGTYTGDGGLFWKGGKWNTCSKQDLQKKFSDEKDPLSILFCTDAASESLNLQTCSVMFNYDIPWNPMRIEQRIGRIDRIGQKAPIVRIFTYTYKGTVEDVAFDRCLERIGFFKSTLGYVQPILESTKRAIKESMDGEVGDIEDFVDKYFDGVAELEEETRIQHLVNEYEPVYERLLDSVPVSQEIVEQTLSERLKLFGWVPEKNTWISGEKKITFDPAYRDQYGNDALFISARHSNLNYLFGQLPEYPSPMTKNGVQCHLLNSDGYSGFAVQCENGYKLISKISEISLDCPGRAFPEISGVEKFLSTKLHQNRIQYLKDWGNIWKNRNESWKSRVKMYLEKIFEWFRNKETVDGMLESFGSDELIGKWNAYLNDPTRKETKALADAISFVPEQPEAIVRKRRGRPRRSPKNASEEQILLAENAMINQEWRKVIDQFTDIDKAF